MALFNENVALRSDLESYIKKYGVLPSDLKNFDLSNLYGIPVANNGNWLSYKLATNAEGLSIPYRNSRGNILGTTAVDDNEVITYGQVKSLIKNPFTPKGELNNVTELPTNAQIGWLYTIRTANQPGTDDYNPNYPTINAGEMVIYLKDENDVGYWDSFSGFVDLSVLNLQRVLENGNIADKPMTIGQKLSVNSTNFAVELNTYVEQGFMTVKKTNGVANTIHFGISNWNTLETTTKINFKSPKNNNDIEVVAYESDLDDYVSFKKVQAKTETEKQQARQNLGLTTIDFEWSEDAW